MDREKISGLLPDYLLSIPVALSLAVILFGFFLIPQSQKENLKAVLFFTFVFLLLIYTVFYNQLTLKISAALFAAGTAIYFAVLYFIFNSVTVFSYSVMLRYLFQTVIFGACAVVYFCSKYLWSVYILLAAGSGLFFYMSFTGMNPDQAMYYMYLAGTVALLTKKLICRRLQISTFKEFIEIYGFSLNAAVIVLVVANFIYTQTDFNIVRKASAVKQASITSYEDLNNMKHFGAPLILNKDAALSVVSSTDTFYLKADTFGGYRDSKWTKLTSQYESDLDGIGNYMWMMAYTYEYDHSFFERYAPSDISAYVNYFEKNKTPIRIENMAITHVRNNFKCLFLPEGFLSFKTNGLFLPPVTENYSLKSYIPAGIAYTVTFPQPDIKSSAVRSILKNADHIVKDILKEWKRKSYVAKGQAFDGSPAENSAKKIDSYSQTIDSFDKYRSKIRAQYLELSPSVTKRTKELAIHLTRNCTDDYEKVMAVKDYLQKNYTYTLNPPQPDKGEDIVDYFLFKSRLGYCIHYASAMTILLRAAGVPSRYVCGFVSPARHNGNTIVITNEQAHAWVEVYSEAFGFYAVDATKGTNGGAVYTPGIDNNGHDIQAGVKNKINQSGNSHTDYKLMPIIVKSIAVLVGILIAYIFIAAFIKHGKFKKTCLNSQAAKYYRYVLFILCRFGFKREPNETLYEFAKKLKGNTGLYKGFIRVTDIYVNISYGGITVEKEDVKHISLFRNDVLKYMRSYAGFPGYIAKKICIELDIAMGKM